MDRKDAKGFTLIELMIAVAIIAILAVIAIPNFLMYRAKAKQAEAKMQLKAVHTSETAYFTENNFYTPSLTALDWRPLTDCSYRYTAGDGFVGNPIDVGSPMNSATPGADNSNFTALAYANIDPDPAVDTWQITYVYALTNVYSDVLETNAQ